MADLCAYTSRSFISRDYQCGLPADHPGPHECMTPLPTPTESQQSARERTLEVGIEQYRLALDAARERATFWERRAREFAERLSICHDRDEAAPRKPHKPLSPLLAVDDPNGDDVGGDA